MKHPVFAANWKMNHAPADAKAFMRQFLAYYARQQDRTVLFFPPALTLQAVSLQLVRQATMGFAWGAAAGSLAPYVCACGALLGTVAAQAVASSDRWMRRGLAERPVDGPTKAPPLAKIGS